MEYKLLHCITLRYFSLECGDSELIGDEGTIRSPRYPDKYPYDLQCHWIIKAPKQHQIVIRFEKFDLEGSSKCHSDFLTVTDGERENSSIIGKYCGSSRPATITTSSNLASIRFVSDTSISRGGFLIRWNSTNQKTVMTKPTTMLPLCLSKCLMYFVVR